MISISLRYSCSKFHLDIIIFYICKKDYVQKGRIMKTTPFMVFLKIAAHSYNRFINFPLFLLSNQVNDKT